MLKPDGIGLRIREERERLGLNQTDFGLGVGVSRGTQKAYELENNSPDLRYVAALENAGADVKYVISGRRSSVRVEEGDDNEMMLLNQYRLLPLADQVMVLRIVTGLVGSSGYRCKED